MKKLFYLVALMAAVSFAACGNKSENKEAEGEQQCCQSNDGKHQCKGECKGECHKHEVPQEILKIVEEGRSELTGKSEDGVTFKSIDIECHDIVITAEFDEKELPGGMTFKQACELSGMTEDFFAQGMKEEMFDPYDEEDMEAAAILRKYEYNIVFRLVGSISGEEMNCKIGYDEMPQ